MCYFLRHGLLVVLVWLTARRCYNVSCFNGGSCVELYAVASYRCRCAKGYEGELCQTGNYPASQLANSSGVIPTPMTVFLVLRVGHYESSLTVCQQLVKTKTCDHSDLFFWPTCTTWQFGFKRSKVKVTVKHGRGSRDWQEGHLLSWCVLGGPWPTHGRLVFYRRSMTHHQPWPSRGSTVCRERRNGL